MILPTRATARWCGFCAVKTGRPTWFDDDEPRRVAEEPWRRCVSSTSCDECRPGDLLDGGARIFAETITRMRETSPGMGSRC